MSKKKHPYSDRNGYAYIYINRNPVALKAPNGTRCKTGTPEALSAYHRLSLEIQSNPGYVAPRGYIAPSGESDVTIDELTAAYLTHATVLEFIQSHAPEIAEKVLFQNLAPLTEYQISEALITLRSERKVSREERKMDWGMVVFYAPVEAE
jgi:hypothetical protein